MEIELDTYTEHVLGQPDGHDGDNRQEQMLKQYKELHHLAQGVCQSDPSHNYLVSGLVCQAYISNQLWMGREANMGQTFQAMHSQAAGLH